MFRKRELTTWLEVRGAVLVTASGHASTMPTPAERVCESAQAAVRERDRLMAELVGNGYVLDEFGAAEAPAAKRRAPKLGELKHHAELEAQLEAAPDDPNAWLVFEDWLLDARDPRAAIIEHERSGDVTAAAQARGAIKKLLLGGRGSTFDATVSRAEWRAGFLRACVVDATGPRGRRIASRSSSRRRPPSFSPSSSSSFPTPPCCASSRRRSCSARCAFATRLMTALDHLVLDAKLLEPLGRLAALDVRRLSRLEPAPCLGRLRSLVPRIRSRGGSRSARRARADEASVSLHVQLVNDERVVLTHSLAPAMPALRELVLTAWWAGNALHLAEQAIASGLLNQLERLVVADPREAHVLTAADRERVLGGAFASVPYVQLPKSLVE